MTSIFQYIGKAIVTVALAIAGIFGGGQAQAPSLAPVGAAIPVAVATFTTSLQASISATATAMTLVSGTDKAGHSLSGYICFNIDEGTSTEEFVCGTTSGTAVTSMIRGLDPVDGTLEVTALKKAHKRGASVKITNYPSLGILSRILNGDETIPNAITYANGIGPTNSGDLADKEYVLSVVSGGAISFEKVVLAGTAGETIATGNLVYLKASDGRWWKTDADTASTVENVQLGIAQGSGSAAGAITGGVLVSGLDSNQSALSANTVYYAGNTAGAISSSAGTKEVTIGIALTTTDIVFTPRYNQHITEDEQDALVGQSGTAPSATNKFLDKAFWDAGLASTTAGGITEEATLAEIDAGTAAGSIGRLFQNPSTPSSFIMGVGPTTVAKTYFNFQLPFILWTGASLNDATTTFANWSRTSTDTSVFPGGSSISMGGSGSEKMSVLDTSGFGIGTLTSVNETMSWNDTNTIIIDFFAQMNATGTGDINLGFGGTDSQSFIEAYNASTYNRVTFSQLGSTGALYATIAKAGTGVTNTDISSGLTLTSWNEYRIELTLGTSAKFYVNGVLKATLSGANLPSSTDLVFPGFGRSNTATLGVTAPNFSIKMR